jgi:hypothetical protein
MELRPTRGVPPRIPPGGRTRLGPSGPVSLLRAWSVGLGVDPASLRGRNDTASPGHGRAWFTTDPSGRGTSRGGYDVSGAPVAPFRVTLAPRGDSGPPSRATRPPSRTTARAPHLLVLRAQVAGRQRRTGFAKSNGGASPGAGLADAIPARWKEPRNAAAPRPGRPPCRRGDPVRWGRQPPICPAGSLAGLVATPARPLRGRARFARAEPVEPVRLDTTTGARHGAAPARGG